MGTPIEGTGPNWDNPIGGVSAASVDEAQAQVSFSIHVPEGLGDPVSIFVSDPGVPQDGRAAAFVYDPDAYGRVANFQRLPEVPADQYDALNSKLAQGREVMHIVTIRSGEQALIVTGGGFVGMYWLENGVEFWLAGPTLSEDQAVMIAEKL